jgi:hypothetical protein
VKRSILIGTALAALALPVGASAENTHADASNAAKECRAERGSTPATREAFRVRYGTNKNGRNAFGKCVSRRTRSESAERKAAQVNAARQCTAERSQLGETAFAAKYGTGKKGRNAFGKCVSQKAKALKDAADARDAQTIAKRKQAAKTCATERSADRAAFTKKYGTNHNGRNAFGKCVSATARKAQA